jgi:hypothetical protein
VANGVLLDIMLPGTVWLATVEALLGSMPAPRLLEPRRLEPAHALKTETAAIDNKNLT